MAMESGQSPVRRQCRRQHFRRIEESKNLLKTALSVAEPKGMSFNPALDSGTTRSQTLAFESAGMVRGAARKDFQRIFPRAG
jgi:hypothetical protein